MSSEIIFEVEDIVQVTGRNLLILARRLDDQDFVGKSGLKLNGWEIIGGDIPRALDKDGSQRLDVWGFSMKNQECEEYFNVGDIVRLSQ